MKKFFLCIFIIVIICGITIFFLSKDNIQNIYANNESTNDIESKNIEESNMQNTNIEKLNIEDSNIESEENNMNNQREDIKINLMVNNKVFSATLDNNETTKQFIEMLPITLNMSDLNSNEKYYYLDSSLITNSNRPNKINAGDIKLYGNNCLVIFYESFSSSYSYTDLGKIDNVNEFVRELGRENVTITFEFSN